MKYIDQTIQPFSFVLLVICWLPWGDDNVGAALALPSQDTSWERGIDLVASGCLQDGFCILDSIVFAGQSGGGSRMNEYARLSEEYFLPRVHVNHDTVDLSAIRRIPSFVFMSDDELIPVSKGWQATTTSEKEKTSMPLFVFSEQYSFIKSLRLSLPPLNGRPEKTLKVEASPELTRSIAMPLVWNPDAPRYKMEVKITVDCSKNKSPLREYLCNIVNNKFDIITKETELVELGALSLRCYKKSVFSNVPDEFCAYIAFDYMMNMVDKGIQGPQPSTFKPPRVGVRYLISAKTSQAVEEKAEIILAEIVRRFEGF